MSDTKLCKFCQSTISAAAMKCPNCQEWLQAKPPAKFNPFVALFFSLVIPGAGFWYRGNVTEGFIWFFITMVVYCVGLFVNPIMLGAAWLIHLLGAFRAAM